MNLLKTCHGTKSCVFVFTDITRLRQNMARYDKDPSLLVEKDMHITDPKTMIEAGQAIKRIYTAGLLQDHPGAGIRVS